SSDQGYLARESAFHDVLLLAAACAGNSFSRSLPPPPFRTADADRTMAMRFQGEPVMGADGIGFTSSYGFSTGNA
ncbi:MAG: hypothetical protein ACREEP_03475, partial [Dongiaceae bacterium]